MKKIAFTMAICMAVFLTGLIGTAPAGAQSCPAGTTPSPAGPGGPQPCIPISDYSGSSSSAPGSSGVSSYAAIARHPDAADIWADGNYSGPNNDAEANSIGMCNRVMGGGCATGGKWWDSSMKILRDSHGDFHNMWMGGDAAQRKQAMAECSAKQLLPCEVFATIRSSTDIRNPGAEARKYYAVSAWVVGNKSSGYNNKLYVASGHRSYEAASAAAIKACSDATSRKCEINTWSGNGVIQAFRMDNSEYGIAETSVQRAKQAAQLSCKQQKSRKCDLQAAFDSRKPGLFVHDFAAAKAE